MAQAVRDQNFVTAMLFESAQTPGLTVNATGDQTTGRLYVDVAGGSGTVTSVSVVSANGFAGSVATATTTPAITLSTTINSPVLAGNGTALTAATTTGSGSTVVLQTSPTLITPVIGVATGTSLSVSGLLASATGLTLEETGAGTDIITLQAPASIAASYTLTLPIDDGNSGEVLSTNGSGVLSWISAGGVPTTITVANEATDTTCFIAFFTAASGDLGPKTNVNMTFNSNTGVATFASTVLTTTDINGGTVDGTVIGASSAAAITGTTITGTVITGNSFVPNNSSVPSNGLYLPAANTLGWAINSAAEMQLTATALSPAVDGGNSLGTTALGWQNLFANTGFVLNIENGDWVATHTAGILTVGTGDLRVTTAGSNSASVVTVGGAQTLTSKTLTSPTLTTPSAFTTGGTITLAENTTIALDPAGSADGKYTGITVTATAGYTQSFGDLAYLDPTDSRWEACDANSAAGADGDARGMLGMVVVPGTDGSACTILLSGIIRADAKFPTFTINNPIYVSETAGAVTQTQPTTTDVVIRIVGAAITADEMYFNPDFAWITHT